MKLMFTICSLMILLGSCKAPTDNDRQVDNAVSVGNKFIDAFYSFNSDSLRVLLSSAQASQPEILYYQKWAECAHYKVMVRSRPIEKNDSILLFPVTVKDDLMPALAIDFNVTDTFHLSFRNGGIVSVKTSSNDPSEYHDAKEWVTKNKPELVGNACEGIWEGGPTPCECVLGMIKGFKEFIDSKNQGE